MLPWEVLHSMETLVGLGDELLFGQRKHQEAHNECLGNKRGKTTQ